MAAVVDRRPPWPVMGGRYVRLTQLTRLTLLTAALVFLSCLQVINRLDTTQSEPAPLLPSLAPSPSALHQLRLSAALQSPAAVPVPAETLLRCLSARQRPLRLLLAGHSRVWQLFWAATARSGAELRSRASPAHGLPYGGDPPPADTPDTCVEVFRRPLGDPRPPACSWAADAPGLQLDLRWRLRVDAELGKLLRQAAQPGQQPDLLVIAVALKETVRERALQRAPQSLWDALQRHLVGPLRLLTAAGVTTVLLLDFPSNRHRAAVAYDRGAGAVTMVQNAVIMQAVIEIPGLHIWTAPIPHVIEFYTHTCQQPSDRLDPETVSKCNNDTFHPGPRVVDQLLDQLLHIVC